MRPGRTFRRTNEAIQRTASVFRRRGAAATGKFTSSAQIAEAARLPLLCSTPPGGTGCPPGGVFCVPQSALPGTRTPMSPLYAPAWASPFRKTSGSKEKRRKSPIRQRNGAISLRNGKGFPLPEPFNLETAKSECYNIKVKKEHKCHEEAA